MKRILVLVMLLVSLSSFAQKVKFKKGTISVDGTEWGQYDKENFGTFYTFYSLAKNEVLTFRYESIKTGKYDRNGNEINDGYMVISFADTTNLSSG